MSCVCGVYCVCVWGGVHAVSVCVVSVHAVCVV